MIQLVESPNHYFLHVSQLVRQLVVPEFLSRKCCLGILDLKFSRKNRYFRYVQLYKYVNPILFTIPCTNWIRHLILWTPKISETGISQILYFQKMVLKNDSLIQQEYFKRTILSSLIWLSHVSKILKYYFVISREPSVKF